MKKIIFLLVIFGLAVAVDHARAEVVNKSRDKSETDSSRQSTSRSHDHSESGAVEININSLLLQAFVQHYERTPSEPGMARVQKIFADCKPLTGIISEYPTLNSAIARNGGPWFTFDESHIVPRRIATHFLKDTGDVTGTTAEKQGAQTLYNMPKDHQAVSRYARCRIVASRWLDEAAQRSVDTDARDENEIRDRIESVFNQMDNDDRLFEVMVLDAQDIWQNADCMPTLQRWPDFTKPQLICPGVLVIDGNIIEIENRPTLSEKSIGGRTYKVSIQSSDSAQVAAERSNSRDSKTGTSSQYKYSR